MSHSARANRLQSETSPYLLQHAHNPVDWFPWGPEALERARREDKPIFLSVGYSACHWCHVMEKESFEDSRTAAVMNSHFINIKVDREERPDVDQIYMTAVQLMTRQGGWPMSVWMTPDLKPFYGGTYFPPEPRYGMPSFLQVLDGVANAWKNRREELLESAEELVGHIQQIGSVAKQPGAVNVQQIASAGVELMRAADASFGGLGQAPKFPHSVEMRLLFRSAQKTGEAGIRNFAAFSLEKMVTGGIYDQLGGGFHRYSTDQRWLVPHFEKMLYDNSLLPLALLEAYQATGKPIFRRATIETLDYVLREMTSPAGGFYSTQDADSEGVEGKFFVWSKAEIDAVLGAEKAAVFCRCYDVTAEGNWEHSNILHLPKSVEQCAADLQLPQADLEKILAEGRCKLFGVRSERIAPGRDEKILTSWNGLMLDAMATAGRILDEARYRDAATKAATFLLEKMRSPGGLLYRTHKDGRSHLNGYLEDYSFLANGLISLYESTFEPRWLDEASRILDVMMEQFWDETDGGFYYTGKDHEALIARTKDPNDGAIPSGNALAATAMARLVKLTGRSDLAQKVEQTFSLFSAIMSKSAFAAAQMLIALGLHQDSTVEIAIVGDPQSAQTRELLAAVDRRFLPNKVIAVGPEGSTVPLLADRKSLDGRPTVYLCRNFACQAPFTGVAALEAELDKLTGGPALIAAEGA